MSVSTEFERLNQARNKLRSKGVELGILESTAKLDEIADSFDLIVNNGSVSATVTEGDTYTIPKGYHNGSGTVSGIAGGGSYNLQSKTVTPTKMQQSVTPDGGYYGLSDVTINAIPANYQDVSSVTAIESDVLANKVFVTSDGKVKTGTMPNNGTISEVLDTTNKQTYTIPVGYHDGTGSVSIVLDEKTIAPNEERQTIAPDSGKVLSQVIVEPIPNKYKDVSAVTAIPGNVLEGSNYVNSEGLQSGTMRNHGGVQETLDTTNMSYAIPIGYHDGTGVVKITTEEKRITPTKDQQIVEPTSKKVLSKITVNAIPTEFVDTKDADALSSDILYGKTAYVNGTKVAGEMPNNGNINGTFDGILKSSYEIPAGYTTGGTISLTDDIEQALAAI